MYTLNPLAFALFALLLSVTFNLSAIYVFHHGARERVVSVDDSRFSKCYPDPLRTFEHRCSKATLETTVHTSSLSTYLL